MHKLLTICLIIGLIPISIVLSPLGVGLIIVGGMSLSCQPLESEAAHITKQLSTLSTTDASITNSHASANCGPDTDYIEFSYATTRSYPSAVVARQHFMQELQDSGIPLPSNSIEYTIAGEGPATPESGGYYVLDKTKLISIQSFVTSSNTQTPTQVANIETDFSTISSTLQKPISCLQVGGDKQCDDITWNALSATAATNSPVSDIIISGTYYIK